MKKALCSLARIMRLLQTINKTFLTKRCFIFRLLGTLFFSIEIQCPNSQRCWWKQRNHIFCFYWCGHIKTDVSLFLHFHYKLKPLGFKARLNKDDQKSFLVLKGRIYIKLHYFEMALSLIKKMLGKAHLLGILQDVPNRIPSPCMIYSKKMLELPSS